MKRRWIITLLACCIIFSGCSEAAVTYISNSNLLDSTPAQLSVDEHIQEGADESAMGVEIMISPEKKTLLHITESGDQLDQHIYTNVHDVLVKELSSIVSNNLFAPEYEKSGFFPKPLYQHCIDSLCGEALTVFDDTIYGTYFYCQGEKTLVFPHDSAPSLCEQEMLVWQHTTNKSILYIAYRFNTVNEKDGEWKIRRYDALGRWFEAECRLLAMEQVEQNVSSCDFLFGISGNSVGNMVSVNTTDSEWGSFVGSVLNIYNQAQGQKRSTVELSPEITLCLKSEKSNLQAVAFDTTPDATFLFLKADVTSSLPSIVLWRDDIDPDAAYLGFNTNSEWIVYSLSEYGEWLEKQILLHNHQQYRESKLSGDIYHPSDWQVEVARRQAEWTREERLALAMEEISHDQCKKLYVTSYNARMAIEHLPEELLVQAEDYKEQSREYYVTRSGQLLFTTRDRLDYGQHGYYFQAFSQPASFCIYYEGNIPENGLLDSVQIRSLLPEHEEHPATDIDELESGWLNILSNDQTQLFGHDEAMDRILRTFGWEYFEKHTAENGAIYYSNGKVDIWSYLDNYFDGDRFTYYFYAFPSGDFSATNEVSLSVYTDGEMDFLEDKEKRIGHKNLYFD